jgi:hypothetical protein
MRDVEKLLAELREKAAGIAKSLPSAADAQAAAAAAAAAATAAAADEEAAAAAAAEAAAAAAAEEEASAEAARAAAAAADDEANAGEDFGKSLTVTDAEGNEIPAVDGWELIKSMQDEMDALRAEVAELRAAPVGDIAKSFGEQLGGFEATTETLIKSLGEAFDAIAAFREENAALVARVDTQADGLQAADRAFAEQATTIKSLSEQVAAYGATGRGRQSVLVPQDRPGALPGAPTPVTIADVFAKAMDLNKAGKLNSVEVAKVTASVNSGRGVPAEFAPLFAA